MVEKWSSNLRSIIAEVSPTVWQIGFHHWFLAKIRKNRSPTVCYLPWHLLPTWQMQPFHTQICALATVAQIACCSCRLHTSCSTCIIIACSCCMLLLLTWLDVLVEDYAADPCPILVSCSWSITHSYIYLKNIFDWTLSRHDSWPGVNGSTTI